VDTVFFLAAKVAGTALRAESWLLLLAAISFWAAIVGRNTVSRIASGGLVSALLLIGFLPLGDLLQRPLEDSFVTAPDLGAVDGIILLGGGEDVAASRASGRPQVGEGGDRYLATIALAHQHPDARVVFAGGSGRVRDLDGAAVSEADVAQQILLAHGIGPERIILERRSRNTAENARLARDLAQPQDGERWVLVTSAFHMPRAMQSFEAVGWKTLVPYPVDHRSRSWSDGLGWNVDRNLLLLNTAVREWVGRAAYAVAGR
jgi:uncharacterized SAM-binding protein YcdF (DUF218 family)